MEVNLTEYNERLQKEEKIRNKEKNDNVALGYASLPINPDDFKPPVYHPHQSFNYDPGTFQGTGDWKFGKFFEEIEVSKLTDEEKCGWCNNVGKPGYDKIKDVGLTWNE